MFQSTEAMNVAYDRDVTVSETVTWVNEDLLTDGEMHYRPADLNAVKFPDWDDATSNPS